MLKHWEHIRSALASRKETGTYRMLQSRKPGIDFYSNDYLGLAQNAVLQNRLWEQIRDRPQLLSGSTGSRLISGNDPQIEQTEAFIAAQHASDAALLFPSGYSANLALCSALLHRGDTLIVDELIHRSVHDGCRMSPAHKLKFRHNDLESLEQMLQKAKGNCYVFIESLYSMDGDFAPVREIAILSQQYGAALIVDEAHAFGVLGFGLVNEYALQASVLATVVTYGKAMGAHGAAVLCNTLLRQYLVNFAAPFIYSTACTALQAVQIETGYHFIKEHPQLSANLQQNINLFRSAYSSSISEPGSPIQIIHFPELSRLKALQAALQEQGMHSYAVYSPSVKAGAERIRICLHSFNSETDIRALTARISQFAIS